jgi:phenylacetate-coenzyme A ligase PaaK-like adenylate-forming protein
MGNPDRKQFENKFLSLACLMRNEWRSAEALRRLQEKKLRRLVDYAYRHFALYRERWQLAGVHPADINTVADLQKLPVIDKQDLHLCTPKERSGSYTLHHKERITIQTSGSSGVMLEFWINRSHDQFRKAQFLRPYLTNGQRPWNRVFWIRSYPITPQQWFRKLGLLPELQMNADERLSVLYQAFLSYRPDILRGYGSAISLLARRLMLDEITPHPIKCVFTDSETLTPSLRQTIEKVFKAPVIDVYGSLETENIAYECLRHEGYHIAADCVIMEFLKDGQAVGPGEEGEIVCTVLDNLTSPFIRYNLHDIGTYRSGFCSCGRSFPLMESIMGRSHEFIQTTDGRQISAIVISGKLQPLAHYLFQYQVIQRKEDLFYVRVVPTQYFNQGTERRIIAIFQEMFPHAAVRVEKVTHIEREKSGKFLEFKTLAKDRMA